MKRPPWQRVAEYGIGLTGVALAILVFLLVKACSTN
jgi:hypothetical protein